MKLSNATLRAIGEHDAKIGLPIEHFYELPLKRHYEAKRAQYEIGYRAAKADMWKTKCGDCFQPLPRCECRKGLQTP